jgi:hypothetical protein
MRARHSLLKHEVTAQQNSQQHRAGHNCGAEQRGYEIKPALGRTVRSFSHEFRQRCGSKRLVTSERIDRPGSAPTVLTRQLITSISPPDGSRE